MVKRNKKGQFIWTTGNGLYKRKLVNGKNLTYSRYVWEKHFGKIPKGMIIHHIDKNKMNNKIENLAMMSYKAHNILHSHSPWNKGLTVKDSKKWAITHQKAQANRLEKMKKRFKETWELQQAGLKLREIAKELNISERQVSTRLKRYKEEVKERKMFKQ